MNNNISKTRNLILCAMFTALMVVATYIKIPVGTVAFTLQSLVVAFAALMLGPIKSSVSIGIYILFGILGLPVFSVASGLAVFAQPSCGFILGFTASAFVTGFIAKMLPQKFLPLFLASLAGLFVLYIFGFTYGCYIMNVYLGKGMKIGALFVAFIGKFIIFDIIKCAIAALLAERLIPVLKKSKMFFII